jgi:hypothetical protein
MEPTDLKPIDNSDEPFTKDNAMKEFPVENSNIIVSIEADSATMLQNSSDFNYPPSPEPKVKSKTMKSMDIQLKAVGDEHRYQKTVFTILSLQWLFATMLIMGQPFIFKPPTFLCKDPNNPQFAIECTEITGGCDGGIIKPNIPHSIVMEFDLYCEKGWLTYASGCVFFAFTCVVSLIISKQAEAYGRRQALLTSYTLGASALLLASFAKDFNLFVILYSLSGGGFAAYTGLSLVLMGESGSAKTMQYSAVGFTLVWAFGEMLLPYLNFYVTDWRDFCRYLVAIPALLCALLYRWVYESPRYLVLKKNTAALQEVMQKIAKFNNLVYYNSVPPVENLEKDNGSSSNESDQEHPVSYGYCDLWRYRSLRKISWTIGILNFSNTFVYFGSMFALPTLDGNFYWNAFFLALSEFIAYLFGSPILRLYERKRVLALTFFFTVIFGGIGLTASYFEGNRMCEEEGKCIGAYILIAMVIGVKFVISASASTIVVYSNEIYPTAVRSLGQGFVSFVTGLGSIAAAVNAEFCNRIGINSMATFVALSLWAIYQLKDLLETRGRAMEDTIEELKTENTTTAQDKKGDVSSVVDFEKSDENSKAAEMVIPKKKSNKKNSMDGAEYSPKSSELQHRHVED